MELLSRSNAVIEKPFESNPFGYRRDCAFLKRWVAAPLERAFGGQPCRTASGPDPECSIGTPNIVAIALQEAGVVLARFDFFTRIIVDSIPRYRVNNEL